MKVKMNHIFIIPDIIPITSSTRKFYNVDNHFCYGNVNSKVKGIFYNSIPIHSENLYWIDMFYHSVYDIGYQSICDMQSEADKYKNAIKISNYIFEKTKDNLDNYSINLYTAIKYFWNRLAYKSGRLDMVIDRVLVRVNANFRPVITVSKLYTKKVMFYYEILNCYFYIFQILIIVIFMADI